MLGTWRFDTYLRSVNALPAVVVKQVPQMTMRTNDGRTMASSLCGNLSSDG